MTFKQTLGILCTIGVSRAIDFHKNNFSLPAPLPKIPYLNGTRVRLNSEQILAFIYLKPKIFSTIL